MDTRQLSAGPDDRNVLSPCVTVIMPVRNGERYIAEAIESILGQTLERWELIIVVNGSTDRSDHIATGYAVQDARVRVVTLPAPNIAVALNTGIALAQAPWIARMDADDLAEPERLEHQLAFLTVNPDIGALGTWGWRISAEGTRVAPMRLGPSTRDAFTDDRDRGLIYLISSSVIFSRDVALALGGFRPDYPQAQDVEFWSRIADAHPVLVLPEPLVSYRIHDDAISTRQSASQGRLVRRAAHNMRRRRQGLPELGDEAFATLEHSQPQYRRFARRLRDRSRHAYRRAGALLATGDPRGIGWLVASFILFPPEPLHRLHEQGVLSNAGNEVKTRVRVRTTGVEPPTDQWAAEGEGAAELKWIRRRLAFARLNPGRDAWDPVAPNHPRRPARRRVP